MKTLYFITLFACISTLLYSQSEYNPIYTATPFLLLSPDARAEGIGSAGSASSPDINSVFWNPSKLSFLKKKNGFHSSYARNAMGVGYDRNAIWEPFDNYNQLFDISGYKKIKNKNTLSISGRFFYWNENIAFTV